MSERFVVEGLGGKKTLSGEIRVGGAKNAILKGLAATILFEGDVILTNVPQIEDVASECAILEEMGARVVQKDAHTYLINTDSVTRSELPDELARKIRASIVFAGPLLARFGKVTFPHPGGDVIGPRPINLFLEGFTKLGATVVLENDSYTVTAKKLVGTEIHFEPISVTATETLMMAAILAEGTTVLHNAAREPEISDLASYLNACGANIAGAGTDTMTIVGGGMLHANGVSYNTPPDRIEAGTFVLLGALAGEKIKITNCIPEQVGALTEMLQRSGVQLEIGKDFIEVRGCVEPKAMDVQTTEYPGFATDLQPPLVVYLTQAHGMSLLTETIWKGRLAYTADLARMGAHIELLDPQHAHIEGATPLNAAELKSPDIRAGLAFLMAAAIAEGTSTIDNVYHIDRGYEYIEKRLSKLGLNIRRETN
ncbi:UDP-N-acetylglucosamine 1-carboxyvinyltransferase [Candidatus Adlerbacteria bacterium RIFOXYC1_FULL_48_26]|uniref:UDP-N-acetylglucosamine 1-carboxyvinyltransferase n=1 Tax=Candidatus Adlerbacteria bacterium RIFOXYC1_FULL_48_26 TaxID=1797247 RepID=A0A1F4Y3T8_9BACT|nr:MAG: UDP-N-acetylglucosamine 1-carboxyvinyltransferase [Candidatus Adlerbacteria bacterium RIFOXYC1_FULL_48_26]OGC93870.1 MAG: UDP-N-acetylglucosamine 1-carboxyvinyltransferase [Candidatus Adlerbacteria bacterium RIFOXYB1_FULL_48_10]OGC94843.1 MAG: UDP-N-acetylglucosamine 1-carboxyvinyltransferase [Candidatus Adlerbacteria bacterium RIFOXYD1_FULL_48_8]